MGGKKKKGNLDKVDGKFLFDHSGIFSILYFYVQLL